MQSSQQSASAVSLGVPYPGHCHHHFALGGLYWAQCVQPADAQKLLSQCLKNIAPSLSAVLIAVAESSRLLCAELKADEGPAQLQLFDASVRQFKALLNNFAAVLKRYRAAQADLIIVSVSNAHIAGELASFARLKRSLSRLNTRVLFVVHGEAPVDLARTLLAQDLLHGQVEFYRKDLALLLQLHYWRNEEGVWGSALHRLHDQQGDWQCAEALTQRTYAYDLRECYLQPKVMAGAPLLNAHWQVCHTPEQMLVKAQYAQGATFVLAITDNREVPKLAQLILALRAKAPYVKIVLRELEVSLRYRDERLLSACGMDVHIGSEVTQSQCLSLIEALRCLQDKPYAAPSLSHIQKALTPPEVRGLLSAEAFVGWVKKIDEHTHNLISHQLLRFELREGLSASHCLAHLKLRRVGDFACLADRRFYLFFFGCRADTVLAALKNTFDLPWNTLFRGYELLSYQALGELAEYRASAVTALDEATPDNAAATLIQPTPLRLNVLEL